MFKKELEIPTPEDIINGPKVKARRQKEYEKAVKEVIEALEKEFTGTNYVGLKLYDCPVAVKPRVIEDFKDKGWKLIAEGRHSTVYIGPSWLETPRRFDGFTHEDLGSYIEL